MAYFGHSNNDSYYISQTTSIIVSNMGPTRKMRRRHIFLLQFEIGVIVSSFLAFSRLSNRLESTRNKEMITRISNSNFYYAIAWDSWVSTVRAGNLVVEFPLLINNPTFLHLEVVRGCEWRDNRPTHHPSRLPFFSYDEAPARGTS